MTPFTPFESGAGGLLIGGAAVLLLLALGRIAGISGILGSVVSGGLAREPWRIAFLAGLPLGAALVAGIGGTREITISGDPWLLVVAGLLVGFGTQLGSGCTSGHGVCGIARGSRRSLAATGVFMAVGIVTVTLLRHASGVGS
jgi:uncharacterized membrane protein YedE/YeeE